MTVHQIRVETEQAVRTKSTAMSVAAKMGTADEIVNIVSYRVLGEYTSRLLNSFKPGVPFMGLRQTE